nr:MAG TPA: hypothetical protein [Caudoviricetes sp.]
MVYLRCTVRFLVDRSDYLVCYYKKNKIINKVEIPHWL